MNAIHYVNSNYGNMKCADAFSISANQMLNLVHSSTYALLMKITFVPDQVLVTELILFAAGIMTGGTIISSTSAFYTGQTLSPLFW